MQKAVWEGSGPCVFSSGALQGAAHLLARAWHHILTAQGGKKVKNHKKSLKKVKNIKNLLKTNQNIKIKKTTKISQTNRNPIGILKAAKPPTIALPEISCNGAICVLPTA